MNVPLEKIEKSVFYFLLLFLPTQLGKHFWPSFTLVSGIRIDYLSPIIYLTDILLLTLIFVWFYRLFQAKAFTKTFASLHLFGIFILFLFVTALFSGNMFNSIYHIAKLVEFFLLFLYIAKQQWTVKKLEVTAALLSIGIIGVSLLSILQFIKHGSLGGLFYFLGERMFHSGTPGIANASVNGELILRPYATFSHPNVLAGYLLFAMLFCVSVVGDKTGKKMKILFLAATFMGTLALLLTLSRVAIILWTLVLVGLGFRKAAFFYRSKRFVLTGFIGIFCMGVALVLVGGMVVSRIWGSSIVEESAVVRQVLAHNSLEMIARSPFWGVGFGNFLPTLPAVQDGIVRFSYLQPVHNIFLLAAAETGVIGFLFLLTFLKKTHSILMKKRRDKTVGFYYDGFILLLITVLLLGQFDHYFFTLQQGQLLFTLLLGLCWAKKIKSN